MDYVDRISCDLVLINTWVSEVHFYKVHIYLRSSVKELLWHSVEHRAAGGCECMEGLLFYRCFGNPTLTLK